MSAPLQLRFVMSAPDVDDLPSSRAEIAVIGRSNVGKSSLLNALGGSRKLAKVSGKPGRTQLLNCFAAGEDASIVDLPGYGYASTASKTERDAWRRRMERYLLRRPSLVLTLLLVDGEIGPTRLDEEMLAWLRGQALPFQVVATKLDKVKASRRHRRRRDLASGCGVPPDDVIWVSAEKQTGLDELRAFVASTLMLDGA
jgi:GTP-binding protein